MRGVEPLERRELLATASVLGEEFKLVQFTTANAAFSGSTTIQRSGFSPYQDSFTSKPGQLSDVGFIQYQDPMNGIGIFQASSGQGTGQDNSGPYSYSYSDGFGVLNDNDGVLTRSNGAASTTFNPGDPRANNTPFGFDSTGTVNFTPAGGAAQTSWNVTVSDGSGGSGTAQGSWSANLVFPSSTTDLQVSNASWGLGDSAFVRFALPGRVLPTSSRLTPVSDLRVFWSSSPPDTPSTNGFLGSALADPVPIYWNHDSGFVQFSDLGLAQIPSGAKSLVFVIDYANSIADSVDTPENNLVALPLPDLLVTSGTGTLTDGVFSFGVDSGGSANGQVTVRNVGSANQTINSVTLDGHALASPPTGLPRTLSPNQSLTLNFNASELGGKTNVDLLIETSTGEIRVPVELVSNTVPVITTPDTVNVATADGIDILPLDAEDFDLPKQAIVFSKLSGPAEVTVDAGGNIVWTPPASPSSYSFIVTVQATDNGYPPKSSQAAITYYVNGPSAVDDSAITPPNAAINIPVLSNDSDPDGTVAANSVIIQSAATHGNTDVGLDGVVRYTPAPGFVGTDTFSYYVFDNAGIRSNLATVTVYVTNNKPPFNLQLSSNTVLERVSGAVIGNLSVSDPDAGQTHTFSVSDSRFEVVGQQLRLKSGLSLLTADGSVALEITAIDSGDPPLPVKFNTTITVNTNLAPWRNPTNRFDVEHDGDVDIQDAIYVIRRLRAHTTDLAAVYPVGAFYPDVNGSNNITIQDAIDVIREVRRRRVGGSGEGEGHSAVQNPVALDAPTQSANESYATDLAFASLFAYDESQKKRPSGDL